MNGSKEDRAAQALDYFHQGYNCSQSVFAAFADVCGLTEETALKLSSPLGAGIGRMREVCGAFCGLSMLAGSLYGNSSPETGEKEKIFFSAGRIGDQIEMKPEDIKKLVNYRFEEIVE